MKPIVCPIMSGLEKTRECLKDECALFVSIVDKRGCTKTDVCSLAIPSIDIRDGFSLTVNKGFMDENE